MNEVIEELVTTVGAAIGAAIALRLVRWALREYAVIEGRRALEYGVPGWAE
jgi:hypothetical protein